MGLFDKVKNFFYDEEDYGEYDEPEEVKKSEKEKIQPSYNKNEIRKREKRYDDKKNEEVSERELFRADSTFNFPMDLDDTIYEKSISTDSLKTIKEEKKVEVQSDKYKSTTAYKKRTYPTEKINSNKQDKKFTPTPIISPIYGVLDKNYKKEDVSLDSPISRNETRKLDYDSVMRKAMKQQIEEDKGIFFNLDESKDEETEDEVKIVYNDVLTDDKMDINNDSAKNDKPTIDDDNILSETKEQDLFNLIDNMYSSDDDDEEDDEE